MEPITYTKPDPNQEYDLATAQANWNAAKEFIIQMVKAAGLTPGEVHDGEWGAFGKWAEIEVDIEEYPGVQIGTITDYEELAFSTEGEPQCAHFEVSDGMGQISHNEKELIYDSPDEVIRDLKNDLDGYHPIE
jgi:hypothetical protein